MTDTAQPLAGIGRGWPAPSPWRRLLHVPDHAADLTRRGITPANPARAALLEQVALRFLAGCNAMSGGSPLETLDRLLADTPAARRGFVAEGAAMGAGLRDALSLRGGLWPALVGRHGARHEYLLAVGAGWAIARTPWRAGRILSALDPLLASLAWDGRGFHDLYFHPRAAWTGRIARGRGDLARAYDNGLGRAVWFVASGDIGTVNAILARFAPGRQGDLLAGLGLAMAYAGPATIGDWQALCQAHPAHRAAIGQGVCFAAEALRRAGPPLPAAVEQAAAAVTGLSAAACAAIAAETRPVAPAAGPAAAAAYQGWRAAIRRHLHHVEGETA